MASALLQMENVQNSKNYIYVSSSKTCQKWPILIFCLFLKKAYQTRKLGNKISLIGFLVNFLERFEDELKIQFDL